MNNSEQQDKKIYSNVGLPENLNWKIKEEAMRRKTTKEQTIILLLSEAVE